MRCCSSSDPELDAYLEGTLSPVRRARLSAHLSKCDACGELLTELRVVDALLLAPRTLEPAPNFSFKVMAEICAMPAPHVERARPLAILATYVVFAWSAIGVFLLLGGASARAALDFLVTVSSRTWAEFGSLASASGRLFGHRWLDITAAMGALLALDVACVGAFVAAFAILRARRRATASEPC